MYDTTGFIGGAIFGLLYAPIVITGMHHSFIAVETQLLADMAKTGGSFIFVIAAMSNIAQGASTLAVLLITKNAKTKGVASAAGISALLGITEPAMFGVNLKLRFPFIGAIIGSSVGAAFVTLLKVKAVALGAAGLPGIISIKPGSIISYIIGMAIAFVVAFPMTFILGKREEKKEKEKKDLPTILIVCEGKNTEPSYFNQFEVTSATITTIGEGYNSESLVQRAYELKQTDHKKYDQVWCVFDKDECTDEQFQAAITLAQSYNFQVAYSNQAFEYWLFLHLNDHQGGAMNRDYCCKEFNKLLAPFGLKYDHKKTKKIDSLLFDLLLANDPNDIKNRSRQALAINRAQRNLKFHEEADTPPAQAESSTTIFKLVTELNKYM